MTRRDLITELGFVEKAVSLMKVRGLTDPKAVATALNEDPEVQKSGQIIRAAHVRVFKDSLEHMTMRSIDAIIVKDNDAQTLVAHAHERLQTVVNDMDRIHKMFDLLIQDIPAIREKALAGNADYPTKEISTALKVIETGMSLVDTLKNDASIRQFLKAGTVNFNNGMSLDEVFELVIRIGEELGHTKTDTESAFVRARMGQKREVIDVPVPDEGA